MFVLYVYVLYNKVTMDLMKKYNPQIFINYGDDSTPASQWSPPSAYASLHEQNVKRGIKSTTTAPSSRDHSSLFVLPTTTTTTISSKEKKIVVLINEGTASAAEVFVAGLRDNGRTVALVGAKTYGKGLIQHTFPTPDGGGLRLTVGKGESFVFLLYLKNGLLALLSFFSTSFKK